eukprot:COSAG06_NODE_21110_length_769_cov_0.908955_1_plen_56_part_10
MFGRARTLRCGAEANGSALHTIRSLQLWSAIRTRQHPAIRRGGERFGRTRWQTTIN